MWSFGEKTWAASSTVKGLPSKGFLCKYYNFTNISKPSRLKFWLKKLRCLLQEYIWWTAKLNFYLQWEQMKQAGWCRPPSAVTLKICFWNCGENIWTNGKHFKCVTETPTFAMRYIYNCGSIKSSLSVQVWMWTSMQLDMEIDMNINAISVSINCVFEINLSWQDRMWTCGAAGKGGRSWGLRQKQSWQKFRKIIVVRTRFFNTESDLPKIHMSIWFRKTFDNPGQGEG